MIAVSILVLGYVAGVLSTIALIPEIFKTWRMKDAREISYYWLGSLVGGFSLWIIYAWIIVALPLLLSSVASLIIVLIELSMALKYNRASPSSSKAAGA